MHTPNNTLIIHLRCVHVMLVTFLHDERSRYLRSGQFLLKLSAVWSLILKHLVSMSLSMLRQFLENVLKTGWMIFK